MPKATKISKHEEHNVEIVDNNPIEDVTSEEESTSSDQEVFFNPPIIYKKKHTRNAKCLYAYIEVPTRIGQLMMGSIIDFSSGGSNVKIY